MSTKAEQIVALVVDMARGLDCTEKQAADVLTTAPHTPVKRPLQKTGPRTLEETICRHLHGLEWRAPVPRREPCAQCVGLGFVVRRAHGGVG